jgi:hypothetical protein
MVHLRFGPWPRGSAWHSCLNGLTGLAARAQHKRTGTVTACGAPALARPPAATRPARGGGAGEVSTRGLRRRCEARFQGGVLTEAMTRLRGGRRQPSAAMFRAGGGERWPVVTRGHSYDSVKARRR